MLTTIFVALAVVPGYAAAVALFMAAAFGITFAMPRFVAKDFRIRKRYKLVENLVWLVCATLGGYITTTIAGDAYTRLAVPLLAVAMIVVLWTNTWEMRQRGFIHQTLMSVVSAAGVAAGYFLKMR